MPRSRGARDGADDTPPPGSAWPRRCASRSARALPLLPLLVLLDRRVTRPWAPREDALDVAYEEELFGGLPAGDRNFDERPFVELALRRDHRPEDELVASRRHAERHVHGPHFGADLSLRHGERTMIVGLHEIAAV